MNDLRTQLKGATLANTRNTQSSGEVTAPGREELRTDVSGDAFSDEGAPRQKGKLPAAAKAPTPGATTRAPRRALSDPWPKSLSAEQRGALSALLKNPPAAGGPSLKDLLAEPSFQTLPEQQRTTLLSQVADLANSGKNPNGPIASVATTARALSKAQAGGAQDAAANAQTLTLALHLKPRDLGALLEAQKSGVLDKRDAMGRSVRDHLTAFATGPTGPGIDGADVLAQLLKDVTDPNAIHQGKRNTCGATSSSILLAQQRPADYARIICELARPGGRATLPDGHSVIALKPDALTDDSQRTLTGRLLQPALMEFADGKASYDNATEKHSRNLPRNIPGLTEPEVARLTTALFGHPHHVHGAGMGVGDVVEAIIPGNRPFEPAALAALVKGKKPALALLDVDKGTFHIPAKGFHWVLVHEIKDGRVYFDDPNRVTKAQLDNGTRTRPGDYRVEPDGRASMPNKDFARVLWSMVTPD